MSVFSATCLASESVTISMWTADIGWRTQLIDTQKSRPHLLLALKRDLYLLLQLGLALPRLLLRIYPPLMLNSVWYLKFLSGSSKTTGTAASTGSSTSSGSTASETSKSSGSSVSPQSALIMAPLIIAAGFAQYLL